MKSHVLASALVLTLCACSPGGSGTAATSAPSPAAAAASGTPAVASAAAPASEEGAEAFLRRAVLSDFLQPRAEPTAEELNARAPTEPADETRQQYADREARENAQLFTPELVDLMRRDRLSTAEGDVGVLDFNPVCMCQDDAGMVLRTLTVAPPRPDGRVQATAVFNTADGAGKTHLYLLERTAAGWRIADVVDRRPAGDGGDVVLLAHLRRYVPEQERSATAPGRL